MESNVLGTRLRTARDRAGLTQVQAAQQLGVGDTALSNYERGERDPDTGMLAQMAALYTVSTDYLLGRTDDPRTLRDRLAEAAKGDPELNEFWEAFLSKRDLRLAFRTLKDLTPQALRQALRIIKALEEEEGGYVPDKPES